MSGFDDVVFEWAGTKYNLPAHRVLGAIARVEDVVTLQELQRNGMKETVPIAKLAMAYGVLLRYVGAKVTDIEIYEALFGQGKDTDAITIIEAITNLVSIMIPPSARKKIEVKLDERIASMGKMEAAAMTNTKLSKKRSKLRSRYGK